MMVSTLRTSAFESFEKTALVLDSALLQDVGSRIAVRRRRVDLAERDGAAQAREVGAGQMAAEVGCGKHEAAVGVVHRAGP